MQEPIITLIRLDLLFETIGGIIALMVAYYATKAFNLTGQKRLSDLSTGFLVLAASLFSHVGGTWYFFVRLGIEGEINPGLTRLIVLVTVAYHVMTIMAYILFVVSTRRSVRTKHPEMVMLLALPVLIDINLEILTIIILLVVVLQAFMNYAVVRSRYALYVLAGFSMFLLSHLFLILAADNVGTYLLSQAFQLLGFMAFLVMLYKAGRE
ncbi:MAG: hypothetical protein ACTSV9_01390 [Candidatus Thorarchaeota archaeon]